MLQKQEQLATEVREFLGKWGLKAKFVAERAQIDEQSFSKFVNHKLALPDYQIAQLKAYIQDYERRNAP